MAVTRIPIPEWAKTSKSDDRLDLSLAEIDLTVRTVNCLEEQAIFTVRDLLGCTPERLLEIPNLGQKTLETIYQALEAIGFFRPSRQPSQPNGAAPARLADFSLLSETRRLLDEEEDD